MYQDIIKTVKELVGNEYLYFGSPIKIKMGPHTEPVNIWGVCVSPTGVPYVMDTYQEWYELEEKETAIVFSVYQRVNLILLNSNKSYQQTA